MSSSCIHVDRLFDLLVRGALRGPKCLSTIASFALHRKIDQEVQRVVMTLYVDDEKEMFTRDEFVKKFDAMYPTYGVLGDRLARSRVLHSFHKTYGYQFFDSKCKQRGPRKRNKSRIYLKSGRLANADETTATGSHSETLEGNSSSA